jgi:chromosomal replication initiation ATPase DnaA
MTEAGAHISTRSRAEMRRLSPSMDAVIAAVAAFWNVSVRDLTAPGRGRHLSHPRQVAMWILHRVCGFQGDPVARALGRQDHTTVLHGARAIDRLLTQATPDDRGDRLVDQLKHLGGTLRLESMATAEAITALVKYATPAEGTGG